MIPEIPKGATPNIGSRARDHLANERTYLAWHRTGLSVAALGVAVAKFAPHRGVHAVVSGGILLFAGLLVSGYGTVRTGPSGGNWTPVSTPPHGSAWSWPRP